MTTAFFRPWGLWDARQARATKAAERAPAAAAVTPATHAYPLWMWRSGVVVMRRVTTEATRRLNR